MKPGIFSLRSWSPTSSLRRDRQILSLIPDGARAVDRRQTEFLRRSIRQLIRHGAWEQAWALIELSTEEHRYNPAFHRACEKARHRLIRRLFKADAAEACAAGLSLGIPDLRRPFTRISNRCEDALIHVDPQSIQHWGCVLFPGISRGRFQGHRQKRFCNAVVEDRYLFRGLPLTHDPQVCILRRRFHEGLSWEDSGGFALYAEHRRRTGDGQISWDDFRNQKLRNWDRLFARIQGQGYLSQVELRRRGKALGRFGLFNEVEVCVSENGKVLFLEGKHRLVIAQILGLPSIPVIVNLWSEAFLQKLPGPFTPLLAQRHLKG